MLLRAPDQSGRARVSSGYVRGGWGYSSHAGALLTARLPQTVEGTTMSASSLLPVLTPSLLTAGVSESQV